MNDRRRPMIEITPDMIAAGTEVFIRHAGDKPEEIVERILTAALSTGHDKLCEEIVERILITSLSTARRDKPCEDSPIDDAPPAIARFEPPPLE